MCRILRNREKGHAILPEALFVFGLDKMLGKALRCELA